MDLAQLIQNHYEKMSKTRKKIASYILGNTDEFMYLTSREIAKKCNTSESSVVRFTHFLGFEKYKDMQDFVRKSEHKNLNIIEQFNINSADMLSEKRYLKAVEKDMKNIQETFGAMDQKVLEVIMDKIIDARHIGVTAMRGGIAPALILKHFLNELFDNAHLLTPGFGDSFDVIKSWNQDDVIVCFEFFPTKNHTYEVLKFAREKGCQIISIVSELAYTIKDMSDYVITVKIDGTLISYTTSVILVNVLLDMICHKKKGDILPNLEETANILKRLN